MRRMGLVCVATGESPVFSGSLFKKCFFWRTGVSNLGSIGNIGIAGNASFRFPI